MQAFRKRRPLVNERGATSELAYLRARVAELESQGNLPQAGPDAFVTFDSNMRLSSLNAGAERLFTRPESELTGALVEEVFRSAAGSDLAIFLRAVRQTGTPSLFECSLQEGTRYLAQAYPLPDGGVAALFRDTTDRGRTETALELAVQAHQIGTFEWSIPTGRVTWSEQEEHLFGLEPGSFEGDISDWSKRVHPDDLAEVQQSFERCWQEQCEDTFFDFRILRPDGSVRYVEGSGRFLYAVDGTPLRMVGVNIDVTERRKTEGILAAQAQELARSNDDLERFAYTASHDLQEPIRTVVTFTQLLARQHTGNLSQQANEYITLILEASNRMSKLVASLLEYSLVSTGGNPEFVPVDLSRVVETVLRLMSFSITDTGANVTCDSLPVVYGNEEQLMQVLQNLLANAIKYRDPQERPVIHISAEPRDGQWLISVSDNGMGFDSRYAETIFGVFKRLHGNRYSGTGIGLAISRRIIERHGGRIWATSEEGKGSVFFFTLPAHAPPEHA